MPKDKRIEINTDDRGNTWVRLKGTIDRLILRKAKPSRLPGITVVDQTATLDGEDGTKQKLL